MRDLICETDEGKAELFASVLAEAFRDADTSEDFDQDFHRYVEDFVLKYDYGDKNFDKVSISELIEVIKGLRVDD